MEKKTLENLLENNTLHILIGKGINNYTSKGRDIAKKLKEFEKLEGKKIPNINPLSNEFNLFIIKEGLIGGFIDLDSCPDRLGVKTESGSLGFVNLELNKKFFPKIGNESENVALFLQEPASCEGGKGEVFCQSLRVFAKSLGGLFGGSWERQEITCKGGVFSLDYTPIKESKDKKEVKGTKGIRKRRADSLGLIAENTLLFFLSEALRKKLLSLYPEISLEEGLLLSSSTDLDFGHFSSNIVFKIAPVLGKLPGDMASELAMKLKDETSLCDIFEDIVSAPNGFLNFFISEKLLFDYLSGSESCSVGSVEKKNILIESPSANPDKPLHVGHLLNACLSGSLTAIFEKIGFKVYRDNLINDKGLSVFKLVWAVKNYALDSSPEKEGLKPDSFVGKYYVLGCQKFDESKKVEEEVRQLLRDWENGDEEIVKIWKRLIDWGVEGQRQTLKRMGEGMGHVWYESDIYKKAKEIILDLVDGEKIIKTSDGAVIGKIEEEYGLSDVVLIKSDGTSLYHTQDFYLTILKSEKFKPWKAIWVVGNEQIVHFQKLFSVIDMLGLLPIDNLYHLAYGFVFGKDGKKMSSRTGEALSGDELLNMMRDTILSSREDIDKKTAEVVGLGALKYAFLSTDPFKDMKFDIDKAVMFNGRSAPYIMYAYARANNILSKAKDVPEKLVGEIEFTSLEKEIVLKCLDYPNIVVASANNYSPSILAEYLYDLAKLFSQMYETESVLGVEGDHYFVKLNIVKQTKEILGDGLRLLKIEPLERM